MWALINNGVVTEITDIDPEGRFHPSLDWQPCKSEVEPGWLFDGDKLATPPGASIQTLTTAAMSRINAAYQAEMAAILREYPEAEQLTFDRQEREAREWQAWKDAGEEGVEPATPLLSNIAQGRSMPKADIIERVIAKSDAWINASGIATGKRQAKEDRIATALEAGDRETLESIGW
ncbi:hypothetical protein [Salinicola avicenniae]|uniref:hypothetical protein n=1 Tax=Salinicola avicenniae TaxID=2916836 RepID=UPI0020733FEF|nr:MULTISPECIES: hypothetical protein [unclassified Salinicola]